MAIKKPPAPLWGWTQAARALLVGLALVLAIGLAIVAWTPTEGTVAASLPDLVIDPNTARPEVLTILPRMGPVLLGRVLAARRERPFDSLDDIDRRVKGVGPRTIDYWRPYLRIEPSADPPGVAR
jgi:competence protein ComEA